MHESIFIFSAFLFTITNSAQVMPSSPKQWETITILFEGYDTSETANENPFIDFRLDVIFQHSSGERHVIPGFYAADGKSADTSASTGKMWAVRFTTGRIGAWNYTASFRTGIWVSVASQLMLMSSKPIAFDGESASFEITKNDAVLPDLCARGRLQYIGERYLRFSDGSYFFKLGTNTPENLLSYKEFDGLGTKFMYGNHVRDWREGDVTWGADKRGKGIIGAVNYLAQRGVNSLFAILMTVEGDSDPQVHPWVASNRRTQFDVSKLEQWNIVFEHARRKGLSLNLALTETENEALFESDERRSTVGGFADSRKLFYREIVARFGHNLGLTITLGEENGWTEGVDNAGGHPWGVGNTHMQRRIFTSYLRRIDAYKRPILVHTFPPMKYDVYAPMLGKHSGAHVEGASLQMGRKVSTYNETLTWVQRSSRAGKPWVVTADEVGSDQHGSRGGIPSAEDERGDWTYRGHFCWANALAGGAGVELFSAPYDQNLQDFRRFDWAWAEFSRVRLFFDRYGIPFWRMKAMQTISTAWKGGLAGTVLHTFGVEGEVYVTYQSGNIETVLDLTSFQKPFRVRWFDVRRDKPMGLLRGSVEIVRGGRKASIGRPPFRWRNDWVALVQQRSLKIL